MWGMFVLTGALECCRLLILGLAGSLFASKPNNVLKQKCILKCIAYLMSGLIKNIIRLFGGVSFVKGYSKQDWYGTLKIAHFWYKIYNKISYIYRTNAQSANKNCIEINFTFTSEGIRFVFMTCWAILTLHEKLVLVEIPMKPLRYKLNCIL